MKTFTHPVTFVLNFFLLMITVFSAQAQFPRKILVENFGGFYHQPQGKVIDWIDSLSEKFPGDVIPVCYYVTPCLAGCDPDDPLSLHKTTSIDNRSFYYPYHTAPATDVYVDGIYGFLPWALGWSSPIPPCSDSTILQRALVPSPLKVDVQHSFNATFDTMHIHVEVTAAATFTGGTSAKLRVVPIEEYIDFPEPVGSFNYYVTRVPRVVRDMTPDHIGVYTGTINAGATNSYDFDWPIYNVYDLNTLRAVAFVQDDQSLEVIQAGQSPFVAIPPADCSVKLTKEYYCPQNGTNIYPEIEIRNDGPFTIHNLNIDFGFYGGNMYNTTWAGNFPPGTSMTMQLNYPMLLPGSNIMELNVQSDLPYDVRPHNNLLHYEPLAHENTLQYMTFYVPGQVVYPAAEGFESGTYPPTGWNSETTGSEDSWMLTPNGGYMGSPNGILAPMGLMHKMHLWNERASLVTPSIDFSTSSVPVLSFDFAYKCKNYGGVPLTYDTLNIWASTDCGSSWQLIYRKDQNAITTVTPCSISNIWTPDDPTDWRTDTVSMLQLAGSPGVLLKFEAVSGEGQSLYLDNINIAEGIVNGITPRSETGLKIFPNPAAGEFTIELPDEAGPMQVQLNDVTGRTLMSVPVDGSSGRQITVNCGNLASGIYTVELQENGNILFREKLIAR